jgi:PAS domain S-box-containing protein
VTHEGTQLKDIESGFASEERFKALVEASFVAVFIHDGERVLEVNQAFTETFGWQADEAIGMKPLLLLAPDARETIRSDIEEHVELPRTVEGLHKDGRRLTLEARVREIPYAGGRARLVVARDVSTERRRDAELREAEERFRSAFENAPIGIALVGPDGDWLRVNRTLCELLGYTEEELLGRTFQQITYPEDLDADLEFVRQVLAGEIRTYQMEKRYLRKDGSLVWALLSVSLVRGDDGDPRYFVSQIEDISARKRYDEELSAHAVELERANEVLRSMDELKSEFIAVASHELKTPLTSVRGSLSTLRTHWDTLGEEERLELLDLAHSQAARLHLLTDELLTLSRIEGGLVKVQTSRVPVASLVHEIVVSVAPDAGFEVTCDASFAVTADRAHMRQIITNYITNAVKYGTAPYSVEVSKVRDTVEIRVRDHGPGVEAVFVDRLFEKFSRSGARIDVPGTGLGLSIVRGLAEANGGLAWYEGSRHGAVFALRLPAAL